MIGLDTNVIVRYLTHDDPVQTPIAVKAINGLSAESPGFVSFIVLAELVWVLDGAYRFNKTEIEQVLDRLLRSKELVIERAELVVQALRRFSAGRADFADCLIERTGHAAGCSHTVTFDRQAAQVANMKLLG
ncbi:MAG TPA: type II toxin-antitoxin system VapC family toxin [Terriglobales bacterium]|jgi:predicted nucleic-acid-binding protein